ncbi:MAG TPA: HAMP domain-containing histidine kinase, partial [Gammaproteobacteria bacterium]|nr:HAMP domain-containing histidine kinase [Gammaproteobacteria bacterium]
FKSNFISTVSHELRTPMTSVLGSLGLVKGLMKDSLPENGNRLIDIAHKNTERLLCLINDILDIEKISSGKIELKMEDFDLMLFIHEAINANAGYAERQNVSFNIVDYPNDTVILKADFAKLLQVMNNLLSNAAKFEPEGGHVDIKAQQRGDRIRISVRDHGPGIPCEFQDKIFEKFSQADTSNTRNIKGTGLGLAIAKAIIEMHKGIIDFESEAGRGATFFIELPVQKPH